MRRLFISIIALFCLSVTLAGAADRKFVLVIDAGHGGHDPGAKGAVAYEKNINLKVAMAFGRYVERNCPDVKVIYTRTTDVFIPLNERANIANKNKADLFISIHSNSLPAGKISRGFETYTLGMHRAADNLEVAKRENSVILIEKNYKQRYAGFDPNSAESYIMFELMQDKNMANSVELAKMIQREACAATGRLNKGVHQAGFLVLRATSMPSCLIELGFISTPDEEQFLNSANGQDALARGIFNAFVKYKNKHFSGNFVAVQTASHNETRQTDEARLMEEQRIKEEQRRRKEEQRLRKEEQRRREEARHKEEQIRREEQLRREEEQRRIEETQKRQKADTSAAFVSMVEPVGNETLINTGEPPVFKVQIITSNRSLRPGSAQFQGESQVESYVEGNTVKYTVGSSTDYNEIQKLRRTLAQKFPECFIVAFRNGVKIDVNQAINEYKNKK